MKRTLLILAASLIAVPHVAANHANPEGAAQGIGAPAGGHIHSEYDIPYVVDVGGVGGSDFIQGNMKIHVTYHSVQKDDDEDNVDDRGLSHVTISAYGPGTDVDQGSFTISLVFNLCFSTSLAVGGTSGISDSVSYATATYQMSMRGTGLFPNHCTALFMVSRTGGQMDFNMEVPVTIFNDDAQPSPLLESTGLYGIELLALAFLLAVGLLLAFAGSSWFATVPGATLTALVGVTIIATTTSFLLMLVAFVAIVAAVVRAVQTVLENINQPKKTR